MTAALVAVLVVLLLARDAARVDAAALRPTLSQGQSLRANDKLVSANGTFFLGFFSPRGGDPGQRYLGVMYARAAEQTVPWVANRDAPVSAASAYSATVTADGELWVLEGDRVVWRTNKFLSSSSPRQNVTLTLLDSGNLVLSSGGGGSALWQSFDHPADTLIHGMRIAVNTRFTSWRSPGDPGTGHFTLGVDPLGSGQLYVWESHNGTNTTLWRSGQWTGSKFAGFWSNQVGDFKPSVEENFGIYYTFNDSSLLHRFLLHPNGTQTYYKLRNDTGEWETVWSQTTFLCEAYNMCGANAECTAGDNGQAVCSCLKVNPRFELFDVKLIGENWVLTSKDPCFRLLPLN
ncbi:hypothetical protein EJB05_11887, partial [Eragrostis curvula]